MKPITEDEIRFIELIPGASKKKFLITARASVLGETELVGRRWETAFTRYAQKTKPCKDLYEVREWISKCHETYLITKNRGLAKEKAKRKAMRKAQETK